MQNSLATSMKTSAGAGRASHRVEMLRQYVEAIDETIVSFQLALRNRPHDGQLVNALAQFRHRLDGQLSRLEAMRHQITDERELRALNRTIQSVKQTSRLGAVSV